MNVTSERPIRKFNPGLLQSDAEVNEQFVVRNRELNTILEILQGNLKSPSCQHILIAGSRGQGKSMLLARVSAALRTDAGLASRFLPIRFTEENHEISHIADFWLETLFHLEKACATVDVSLARQLAGTREDLAGRWREPALGELAQAAALEAADRLDKKLVLMVENFQTLCRSGDEDFGWKLRGVLQSEPQIVLIASATTRFRGLDDAQQPFFELFRIIDLEPLDRADCGRLWRSASGASASAREIRPLQILTGGNPRLLVMVAGFARHRSVRQLIEELVTIIDECSEYFRGHLETLANQERRVYLAVLDLWNPVGIGEIAARARMDIRIVSTLLGRLVDRGAVMTEGAIRKRKYSPSERLYSIYYKLRRERNEAIVVRSLIRFISVFYTEVELIKFCGNLLIDSEKMEAVNEEIRNIMNESKRLKKAVYKSLESKVSGMEPWLVELAEKLNKERISGGVIDADFYRHLRSEDVHGFDKWIANCDELIKRLGDWDVIHELIASLLSLTAYIEARMGNYQAVIKRSNDLIDRFPSNDNPAVLTSLARGYILKAEAHEQLDELETAIQTYECAAARFRARDNQRSATFRASAIAQRAIVRLRLGYQEDAFRLLDDAISHLRELHAPESEVAFNAILWVRIALLNEKNTDISESDSTKILLYCDEFEQTIEFIAADKKPEMMWRSKWSRLMPLLVLGKRQEALDTLCSAYEIFAPNNETMLRELLWLVPNLISHGLLERELLGILEGDTEKSDALAPLIVALRRRAGEAVHVAVEVLEVAKDIGSKIDGSRSERASSRESL